jgi:hypothetical protein
VATYDSGLWAHMCNPACPSRNGILAPLAAGGQTVPESLTPLRGGNPTARRQCKRPAPAPPPPQQRRLHTPYDQTNTIVYDALGREVGRVLACGTTVERGRLTDWWHSYTTHRNMNTILPWSKEPESDLSPGEPSPIVKVIVTSRGDRARYRLRRRPGSVTGYQRESGGEWRLIQRYMNPFGRWVTWLPPLSGIGLHGTNGPPCGTRCCDNLGAETHGCIRASNDGIQWIHDNVPLGTPVETS